MYKHGIEVFERGTSYTDPLATRFAAQVVVGTAPIYKLKNPQEAVNKVIRASSFDEAKELLGYQEDWKQFTLCASMKASFELTNVYPVFFINVLDPKKHRKEQEEKAYEVKDYQVTLDLEYVMLDSLQVKTAGESGRELIDGQDYIADYTDADALRITLLSSGSAYAETSIVVGCSSLDPKAVTEEDIIGAYDESNATESGLEVIRTVYPRFGIAPGLILAPYWSQKPNVAAALQGKCEELNGIYRCECVLELDTQKARKYTECKTLKDGGGYTGKHSIVLWPAALKDGKILPYSAVWAALASYLTANNGDVPYLYPSNHLLNVDGAVLDDEAKTEVTLDQMQAAYLNGDGIVTLINDSGWKSWGNNCGCFPEITDPKDRWIGCRRMFSYVANYFIITYREKLDDLMNKAKIDDVINAFNIWGNSLVAQGMCAGLRAEFIQKNNNINDLLNGRLKVNFFLAPFTPMEYIEATAEFDVKTLQMAILGEEV